MKHIETLMETVLSRKAEPREGSYTSYLFEKGEQKILKKVGEESTEVIIASLAGTKEELIGESADLLYHLVVLWAEKGVTTDEVNAELEKRAEKQGNLKPERKPVENW